VIFDVTTAKRLWLTESSFFTNKVFLKLLRFFFLIFESIYLFGCIGSWLQHEGSFFAAHGLS